MRQLLLLILFFIPTCFLFSQENENEGEDLKHRPSLTIGVSGLSFTGDVGKLSQESQMLDARLGYYFAVEQRFGKILGISLGGLYGKLAGTDNSIESHRNFQTNIMQGELLLTANFDKVFKEDPLVSPFLNVGIGYMLFDPYGDLKRGNQTYYYWTDGSIRDLPDLPLYQNVAQIIKRDYTYETQLKDSLTNYPRNSLFIPLGGGLNFHFGYRWTASIGVNYVMCLSDYIDNYKKGGNDTYVQANVGLQYEFKKKKKSPIQDVDFNLVDHLDVDKDGVPDDEDRCHGTPPNVPVDKHGCPLDSDHDGIADYLDKEPNTKKGAKVDGFGVTINEEEIARRQLEWDSLATERSEKFNETPSYTYLKSVEERWQEVKKDAEKINPKSTSKIPKDLKEADLNNDGFISAQEISKTIDGFFEGSNDMTVDRINALIDFFFEQ